MNGVRIEEGRDFAIQIFQSLCNIVDTHYCNQYRWSWHMSVSTRHNVASQLLTYKDTGHRWLHKQQWLLPLNLLHHSHNLSAESGMRLSLFKTKITSCFSSSQWTCHIAVTIMRLSLFYSKLHPIWLRPIKNSLSVCEVNKDQLTAQLKRSTKS